MTIHVCDSQSLNYWIFVHILSTSARRPYNEFYVDCLLAILYSLKLLC